MSDQMPPIKAISPILFEGITQQVYESIKEQIMDMALPAGSRISIDQICKTLGVSSSPVREALARLSSEGLVSAKPRCGYRVAEMPDKKFFLDLIDARMILETHCAAIGAPRKDIRIIESLCLSVQMLRELPLGATYTIYKEYIQWDTRFHEVLVESGENQAIIRMYRDMHPLLLQSRLYLQLGSTIDVAVVSREHEAILEAYREGNEDGAVDAVRMHLEHVRVMYENVL